MSILHTFLDTKPLGLSPSEYQVRPVWVAPCEAFHRSPLGVTVRPGPGLVLAVRTILPSYNQHSVVNGAQHSGPTIIRHSGTSALALTLTWREKDDILNTIISWCDWREDIICNGMYFQEHLKWDKHFFCVPANGCLCHLCDWWSVRLTASKKVFSLRTND